MAQRENRMKVTIEEIKDSSPVSQTSHTSVVIETESTVDGKVRDTSIEVRDVDTPAVAVALLNADVEQPASPADLPTAVQCLAAGVMPAASSGMVRLHLQFESGQVLPVEISHDAARALSRTLAEHVGAG